MFTSATLAASRLSALEGYECLRREQSQAGEDCLRGNTQARHRPMRKPLGSSLMSVAALISKLDEEQPTQWESRSAPTMQLRPIRKTDEALRIFLKKVEAHRANKSACEADTNSIDELFDSVEAQTVTLDRVPALDRELRRSAYSLLMKNAREHRDFAVATDNRFNASTSILTARAQAIRLAERMLRRVDNGFTVTTMAWTLTVPTTENTPALFESCRTPISIRVSVQDCHQVNEIYAPVNAMSAVTSVR